MKNLLNVITHQSWVYKELKEALPHVDVKTTFGWDIHRRLGQESFWVPTMMASRIIHLDSQLGFISPGAYWHKNIPVDLLGRELKVLDWEDFKNYKFPLNGAWCKPADMKLNFFEAKKYNQQSDLEVKAFEVLLPQSKIMVSETILDLSSEYRFYVKGSEISDGSCYLRNSNDYYSEYDLIDYQELTEVRNFTVKAIQKFSNSPETYVLDVGFDENTQNWVIIELNPVWSSAFYGNDLKFVYECLKASVINPESTHEEFLWSPDAYLQLSAKRNRSILNFI